MRELGVDVTDSPYCPVVSRASNCEDVKHRLQTQNDVVVISSGENLALHRPKGLSLPNNQEFKLLLKALSIRVESKRLVRTVVQCSEFYRVDNRGRRVDAEALEGGNRSADPGITTPLCFIADPLTWHKPTSARRRQQFKGIRERFYSVANLHHVTGTNARHKSAKTSGVVDFSAIFGLNYLTTFVGEITFFERLPSIIMESQLCNEPGETSVSTAQGNGLPAHTGNPSFAQQNSRYVSLLLVKRIRYWSRAADESRKIRNEVKLISQTLSVEASAAVGEELLDRIRSSLLKGSEDEQSTGQGSHPDYDPVNVRSTVQEIASLQEKLQATHDEGEQCALEEDINGKILWFYWRGIRSEVDQLLPKAVDRIRNDADEDYHYRTGLRQIAEIIKRAPREIPGDNIVHLRRVMYDAGTGVSRHRLWLDAQATEQAELSRILGGKPILAIEEIASSTNPELPSTSIVQQILVPRNGKL
ncbi:hypothetical protein EDC04DRAFT_3091838 [Pisolithus marmoratus]|nr:hypothetical protein EDC04DRAFT_3091838 [Pisolithus marmoratus]